jgi:uncharacterized protein YndB with AHSA1/START domain
MRDVIKELEAVHRSVANGKLAGGEGLSIVLRRTYAAEIEQVWDAITNPERIPRWFLPVTGDLRLGGRYQFEGNAGGEILRCEAPQRLTVSWVMGDAPPDSSEVDVRLTEVEGSTELELVHTAVVDPALFGTFGPGAVGVGWDGGLLGLALHLAGGGAMPEDKEAWAMSDEARAFYIASADAWAAAHEAYGVPAEEAAAAAAATKEFYAPTAPPDAPQN